MLVAGLAAGSWGCGTTSPTPFGSTAQSEASESGSASANGDSGGSDSSPTTGISDTADSASGDTSPSTTDDPGESTTAGDSQTGETDPTSGTGGTSTTGGSTSGVSGGSTTDDATTGGTSNPVGYGDCANGTITLNCVMGEGCILDDTEDPTLGVCSDQSCNDASECPLAPAGGDAVVTCADITGNMANDCYLDCSNGETCPTGMRCGGGYICVWDVIGADPIGFGDCFNNEATDVCLFDEGCLSDTNMTASVCYEPGCSSAADCPQPPPGGAAPVTCTDVTGDMEDECILDCSAAQACPTGMSCFNNQFCMWS